MPKKKTTARRKKVNDIFKGSDVMVLLEDVRDDIKVVSEGLSNLNEKVERSDVKFEARAVEVDGKFNTLFQFLSRIEDELVEVRAEIAELKKELKGKAEISRLKLLEQRVAKLERELARQKAAA